MMNNRVAQWWGHLPALVKAAMFAGAAVIIAAIMFSGFFTTVPETAGGVYVVNRYTGSVTYCFGASCHPAFFGGKQ